jgi:hypothetical protein
MSTKWKMRFFEARWARCPAGLNVGFRNDPAFQNVETSIKKHPSLARQS